MLITGLSAQTFEDIVAKLNVTEYDGNIVIEDIASYSGNRFRVKLGTADSKRHGSRTAAGGRHGKYLCWHGFRDVVRAAMDVNPKARVQTRETVYRGREDFEDQYTLTGSRNVGSMFAPAYFPELCVGHCNGDYH